MTVVAVGRELAAATRLLMLYRCCTAGIGKQCCDTCMGIVPLQLGGMYAPFYSLSKAAMNRATELLAKDPSLTSRGITIAAVTPGWCRVR